MDARPARACPALSWQRARAALPAAWFSCSRALLRLGDEAAIPPPSTLPPRIPEPTPRAWMRTVGPHRRGRATLWGSLPLAQKEKLSAQASLKRHTSLNDLSLTRDEQEIEFLRLQVLEQQHVIDDLSLVRPRSGPPGAPLSGVASWLRALQLPRGRQSLDGPRPATGGGGGGRGGRRCRSRPRRARLAGGSDVRLNVATAVLPSRSENGSCAPRGIAGKA